MPFPTSHVFVLPAVHMFCPLSYPQFSVSYLFSPCLVICFSSPMAPSLYIYTSPMACWVQSLLLSLPHPPFPFLKKFCTSSVLFLFPNLRFLCRPPIGLTESKSLRALEYLLHSMHLYFQSSTNGFLSLSKIMKTVPHTFKIQPRHTSLASLYNHLFMKMSFLVAYKLLFVIDRFGLVSYSPCFYAVCVVDINLGEMFSFKK